MLYNCIVLCILFSSVLAHTIEITVSGGSYSYPYYNFGSTLPATFVRGNTYKFVGSGISTSHPFSVGVGYEDAGTLTQWSGKSASEGIRGNEDFQFTIPSNFDPNQIKLKYFCTEHPGMQEDFDISIVDAVPSAPPAQVAPPSKAKCNTHTCPSGKVLIASASSTDCSGTTCDSVDDTTCCENGYSFGLPETINLCPDDSDVNIVWAGTHNIQESDGYECLTNLKSGSEPLTFAGSTILNGDFGFLPSGTRKQIAANNISDWESTRFFRCTQHCGGARLRVTCSRANPSPACPSVEYDAKSRKYDPQVRTCPTSPDYVLGSQTDASLQNGLQPLCRCESCYTLLSPMVAPGEICHNGQLIERAACDANACKPGSNLKSDAGLKCKQEECAPARDHDICCDAVKCDENKRVEANACVPCDENYVNDAGDDATGVDTQCDITALCSSYTCPLGHASNAANSNKYCKGVACGADDDTECCLERAMCSSLNNCGKGYVKTNPSGLCVGSACDTHVAADFSTCCTLKTCPAGEGYVSATDLCEACEDGDPSEWNAADNQSPCGYHAGCPLRSERFDYKSHTNDTCVACAAGKQTGADAFATTCDPVYCLVNQHVENNKCKACADNYLNDAGDDASKGDTSCTEKEKCDDYTCPGTYLSNTANGGQYCRDATCGILDRDVCCMQVGKCSSLTSCGHGYELNTAASDSNCAGATCEVPADLATCCQSIKCPAGEGYVNATDSCETCSGGDNPTFNAANDQSPCGEHNGCVDRSKRFKFDNDAQGQCIDCAQGKQTANDKFATDCVDILCDANYNVVNYECKACPQNYLNAAGDKASVGSTDCDEKQKCRDYTCPNGYARNAANNNKHCTGATCDNSDVGTCCVARAQCSTLNDCGKAYVPDPAKSSKYCRGATCKIGDDRDLCCTTKKCPAGQGYVISSDSCETCDAADPPEWNAKNDDSPCGPHNGCARRQEYFVYSNKAELECVSCASGTLTGKSEFATTCDELVPKGFGDDLQPLPSKAKPKTRSGGESGSGGRCGCSDHCGGTFLRLDRATDGACRWTACEACEFCENEDRHDYCNEGRVTITRDVDGVQTTETYSKHDIPVKPSPQKTRSEGRCGCSASCKSWLRNKAIKNGNLDYGAICQWTACEGCEFCETDGVKYGRFGYCSDHHDVEVNATQTAKTDGRCGCDVVKCPQHLKRSGLDYDMVCAWTDCERCDFCEGRPRFDKCRLKYDTHEAIDEAPVIEKSNGRCGCNANCVKALLSFTTASGHDYSQVCTWTSCEACNFCENEHDRYAYCHDTDGHARIVSESVAFTTKDKDSSGRCGCSSYCLNSVASRNWDYAGVCTWTGCEGCTFCADGQHGNYALCQ